MCQLCNGTHVVHEVNSFGYRTSCCPVCGPVPHVEWLAQLNQKVAWLEQFEQKEGKHS